MLTLSMGGVSGLTLWFLSKSSKTLSAAPSKLLLLLICLDSLGLMRLLQRFESGIESSWLALVEEPLTSRCLRLLTEQRLHIYY